MTADMLLSGGVVPGLLAALALAGVCQAALARDGARRLFGLATAFLGASATFAAGGFAPGGADPAGEAAAVSVLLLALGWIGTGAALALRRREAAGEEEGRR